MAKGSNRFSAATRQTGGDSDGISHRSSKKLKKLSCMSEMNQSSQSTSTTTSSKRVKLPKKFFDDYDTVNHLSVPRKLRSAMKKRDYESVSPSSPNNKNVIRRFEMDLQDCNRKLKVGLDEQRSTMSELNVEKITKDEEEAMAALVAMAGIIPGNDNNNTSEEINLKNETSSAAEASNLEEKHDSKTCGSPTASKPKDSVRESVQIEDLNETRNAFGVKKESKDVTGGNKSRKRCSSHVYICQFIKDLQLAEGKKVNLHQEPKQRGYTDAKTEKIPEDVMDGNADKISNKFSTINRTIFQDDRQAQNHLAAASGQVSALPLFGSPLYDPSQWSRPLFPKQNMWMNPFMPGARYQNWPNSGCETMPAALNYAQSSLVDGWKTPQQLPPYKMQFGHRSSEYEENGGLFSSATLKLSLR